MYLIELIGSGRLTTKSDLVMERGTSIEYNVTQSALQNIHFLSGLVMNYYSKGSSSPTWSLISLVRHMN